jgi:hypothetical protein
MAEKGTGGGRLERQTQLEEEDNVTAKWMQEDVNTLYSLLNNNKRNMYRTCQNIRVHVTVSVR